MGIRNKDNAQSNCSEIMEHLRWNLKDNHVAIMQYFVPLFVEECLLNISEKIHHGQNVIQQLFTSLFVKWNTVIRRLLERFPCLIAHFFIILLQKRYKLMMRRNEYKKNGNEIKCSLMVIWSSTLLMDADNDSFWQNNFKYSKKSQTISYYAECCHIEGY